MTDPTTPSTPPAPGGYAPPAAPAYPPPAPPDYAPPGPTQYTPPPAPPARRGQWIKTAVVLAIVAVVVVGFVLFRDRVSNDVSSLQPGECFDQPTETTVTDVQRQPCNEPHDSEVFANVTHTAAAEAAYPIATEFGDLADDECVPQLLAYSGLTTDQLDVRGVYYGYFYPTRDGWARGDRVVTCYFVNTDGSKMTGTIRGAGSAAPIP